MSLLTPELRAALRSNDTERREAFRARRAEPDAVPLVKLFSPMSTATWLATELAEDGDTLFGLADLGFGCPELGSFSLSEIAAVRLPFGLAVERDEGFRTQFTLSIWSDWSRRWGSILFAETLLRRVALARSTHAPATEIPPGP